MRYIADLHVHSHYSRATSKDLNLESLYRWARIKGINVVGTGDFTHPAWFAELKEKLKPDGNGFFVLKDPPTDPAIPGVRTADIDVRFCLTTEISSIYKYGDRVRKNHNLVYAPDLDTVARINHKLSTIGNLEADGRPILGLPSRDLLEIVLETSDRVYLIPAHVWTPWFSTLGSKAGYDSIDACFRDLTDHIFAVETGLSSDPAMNRKLSALDRFTLISNSDAHSPAKLGREANLLDTELSYDAMFKAFKTGESFQGTYEFHPEEGKYHHDGHRKCNVALEPKETKKYNGICPVCGKPLTVGVLHRVEDLADRDQPDQGVASAGYRYIIPLPEVLSEIEGVGPKTKTVQHKFGQVISGFGNEFTLLNEVPVEDIQKKGGPVLAEAIRRIRNDEVDPHAGYDGVFGVINVFKEGEIERIRGQLGFFGIDEYKVDHSGRAASPEISYNAEQETTKDAGDSFGLNDEQQEVVESQEGATLVKAGPGTGKTHTLIEWIVERVESGRSKPEEVLVVTFTNKAAGELKERLASRIGDQARSVITGTFHALCWQWLRRQFPDLTAIYDTSNRRMVLQSLYPALNTSEITSLADQTTRYLELDESVPSDVLNRIQDYRKHLWKHGAIDLSDLIRRTLEELEADSVWLEQMRLRLSAVAVDEFQDINPMQYRLVSLIGKDHDLLAIGDPDQAIYGFRGSDVSLFYRFAEEFDAKTVALVQNYRSTEPILEAAGSLIRHNELHSGVRLNPNKKSTIPIHVFSAENPFEEADYILDQIKKYVGGTDSLTSGEHTGSDYSYGFEDIAVLFRTKAVGERLVTSLINAGIPAHYGDGSSFLAEPPFTVVSNMLHLWLKPDDRVVLSNLLSEAYGWNDAQISSLLTSLNTEEATLFGDDPLSTVSESLLRNIEDLRMVFEQLAGRKNATGTVQQAVRFICDHYLSDDALSEEDLLKKETLLALATETGTNVESFLEQMQLNPYTDAGRLKTEGINLLTFHAAKGLEFPVVFITGAEEGITPVQRKDTDLEEERRLFYVAMTRAKDELHITHAENRARFGEIHQMEASRFLDEIPDKVKVISGKDILPGTTDPSEQLGLF